MRWCTHVNGGLFETAEAFVTSHCLLMHGEIKTCCLAVGSRFDVYSWKMGSVRRAISGTPCSDFEAREQQALQTRIANRRHTSAHVTFRFFVCLVVEEVGGGSTARRAWCNGGVKQIRTRESILVFLLSLGHRHERVFREADHYTIDVSHPQSPMLDSGVEASVLPKNSNRAPEYLHQYA